ncbi:MAG: hypothetical protein JJU24_11725 [Natronohydrobacter sp.]|nr:hypothetical protein [Natronohydrobacter sp.]
MTRILTRSAVLLGLGLTLTACAQHRPAEANCFNFRDAPARAASAVTVSTSGELAIRRDTSCDFVRLGAGS